MTVDPVSLGITVALSGINMAIAGSQRIEGPRLDDLNVMTADYGARLPIFWGVRRFEGCPVFFAEDMKEVKIRSKTKGGKTNNYTYFATWANAIAGHEISGVTRMWWDRHLVYDATGAGPLTPFPLSYTSGVSKRGRPRTRAVSLSDRMRIYLGTATQEPDPRMLATVEAEHGEGSCPAYRDTPYVIWEEVPVEKFGNRIPQVTIEAVRTSDPAFPYESFAREVDNPNMWTTGTSPDGSRLLWITDDGYELWDLTSRTRISTGTLVGDSLNMTCVAVYNDGSFLVLSGFVPQNLHHYSPLGALISSAEVQDDGSVQDSVFVCEDGYGVEHWLTAPLTIITTFYVDGVETSAGSWRPSAFFTDLDGNIWSVGTATGGTIDTAYFRVEVGVTKLTGTSIAAAMTSTAVGVGGGRAEAYHYRDADHDHFVLHWGGPSGTMHLIDPEDGTVLASDTGLGGGVYGSWQQFNDIAPGAPGIWMSPGGGTIQEISSVDLSVIRTFDVDDWVVTGTAPILYLNELHALAQWPSGSSTLVIRYLDRIGSGAVTLATIAGDVADMVGIEDHDFSALTQQVDGYSAVLGAGRDILEPLFTLHDCDIAPHDFTVRGVNRGGTASTTLTTPWFVRQGSDPRYSVTVRQSAELPRAIAATFADVDHDQQPNSVRTARPVAATDAKGEMALDLSTLALAADDATDFADRYLRRLWGGRRSFDLALTAQQLRLEPCDLRILDLDGETVSARLVRQTIAANDVIRTEWEYDHPLLNTLAGRAGPGFDSRPPEAVLIASPAMAAIMDMPLIADSDETRVPFLYYAAGPLGAGAAWTGADIWSSDTGLYDDFVASWGSVPATDAMAWGVASDALPAGRISSLFDSGSTLNVDFRSGSPTGATQDELLADPSLNLIAVGAPDTGWELLQYATATLEGDGTWTLSGFLGGRRGSEWAMDGHAARETVVLLDAAIFRQSMGIGELGDLDAYRAVANGRSLASALEQSVTFTAAAQKPYAPVAGVLLRDTGSGDWSISATRRTRIGGGNVDGQDVPLGETGESWSCDVMDGADVVRTITGTALPLAYTSAQQTADFGSPQTSLTVNLYQVAPDISLRGYPLALAA